MAKKVIRISATSIDNQLWECQKAANRLEEGKARMYGEFALYTLTRYISTARASCEWLRMFINADAQKLMKTAAKHGANDDDCLKAVNKYLTRYYGKYANA